MTHRGSGLLEYLTPAMFIQFSGVIPSLIGEK